MIVALVAVVFAFFLLGVAGFLMTGDNWWILVSFSWVGLMHLYFRALALHRARRSRAASQRRPVLNRAGVTGGTSPHYRSCR